MLNEESKSRVLEVLRADYLREGEEVAFTGYSLAQHVIERAGGDEEATEGYPGSLDAWRSDVSSFCRELFFAGRLPGWAITLGRFNGRRANIFFPVAVDEAGEITGAAGAFGKHLAELVEEGQ